MTNRILPWPQGRRAAFRFCRRLPWTLERLQKLNADVRSMRSLGVRPQKVSLSEAHIRPTIYLAKDDARKIQGKTSVMDDYARGYGSAFFGSSYLRWEISR